MPNLKKPLVVTLRTTADVKAAIDAAAEADGRSVTSYLETVLCEWLRAGGYLPAK